MQYTTYTVKINSNFNRLDFAKWVLSLRWFSSIKSVPKSLGMADDLIRGCEFQMYLSPEEKASGDSLCTITEVVYVDPFAADRKRQAEYFALRDRGAEGAAEAAIAYCKLEVQGLPNHAAIG
jgi:hypothetical protein